MGPTLPVDFQVAEPAMGPRGRFVVLEGIDGCGKSTQLEALRTWLPGSGLLAPGAELVVTREPGGTALGSALRQLLLQLSHQRLKLLPVPLHAPDVGPLPIGTLHDLASRVTTESSSMLVQPSQIHRTSGRL